MPKVAEINASTVSSRSVSAISVRAGTPRARSVRNIGRRCSNARPIAPWTIKRPTTKDNSPKAVRFRWKLSVRRARSAASSGLMIFKPSGRSLERGVPAPVQMSRESRPSIPASPCAIPISANTMPGARFGAITTGGRSSRVRRAAVAGAARSSPGGVMKLRRSLVPPVSETAPCVPPMISEGALTGSTPNNRTRPSPPAIQVSTRGETGRPARRSATYCASLRSPASASIEVRSVASARAASS